MTEITLTAIYEEAEEGGYIGYIAELPGANTQSDTMEGVRENLLENADGILDGNPVEQSSPEVCSPASNQDAWNSVSREDADGEYRERAARHGGRGRE